MILVSLKKILGVPIVIGQKFLINFFSQGINPLPSLVMHAPATHLGCSKLHKTCVVGLKPSQLIARSGEPRSIDVLARLKNLFSSYLSHDVLQFIILLLSPCSQISAFSISLVISLPQKSITAFLYFFHKPLSNGSVTVIFPTFVLPITLI